MSNYVVVQVSGTVTLTFEGEIEIEADRYEKLKDRLQNVEDAIDAGIIDIDHLIDDFDYYDVSVDDFFLVEDEESES